MFWPSILISAFIFLLTLSSEVSASSYSPGAVIAMTGSNTDVRFDVAADLFGFDAIPAALISSTMNFTGAFYATGIGWIEFSTGWYQVWLDCGAQSNTSLSSNCTLTSTGWSENIGEIGFAGIQYNPNTGLLEGSVTSNMWAIDLSGIALPLRPVIINESSIIANKNTIILVSWAQMYEGGTFPWNIDIFPIGTFDNRLISWTNGVFSIDLSLAVQYTIRVTDTNNSTTTDTITVYPGSPSTTLDGGPFYAKTFCNAVGSGTTNCPDTTSSLTDDNRTATVLEQAPPVWSLVANSTDTYHHTMKTRDTYGNRVETGSIKIKYITTVKNVQVDPLSLTGNPNYGPSLDGDAFISSELVTGLLWSSETTKAVWIVDFQYAIASSAPTNINNNIKLESIKYLSWATESILIPANVPLIFVPLFTASTSSATPIIGVANTFSSLVTENGLPTLITPYIISTLLIGDGSNSEWRTLSSSPVAQCTHEPSRSITRPQDDLCEWESRLSSIATQTGSDFSFLATYTAIAPTPSLESTTLQTYIYYKTGTTDILYQLPDTGVVAPITATQRMRVFGQISEWLGIGSQNRVNIINKLRENTTLLSRNRSDYTSADYVVYTGSIWNKNIIDTDFNNRRTIIVIGRDITISENISLRDHPLALIALTDTNNQGGNIFISWAVTDIHSTLIAEHGLTSEISNKQLYIHGSVVSANPPRETKPTTCPYYHLVACTASDYDLPDQRSGFTASSPATDQSLSGSLYVNPLIIVADTRLISDPPPTLNR